MPDVSILIPIAPYHTDLANRAIESAQLQTVECTIRWGVDKAGKGPGYTRNRLLEQTESEFVVFLDADDWIEPTFVEACLSVWRPDHYVYTDWLQEDTVFPAPDRPWCDGGGWHPITTLIPKSYIDEVQGFAKMPGQGGEDTEFYWALTRQAKCCGIHLEKPLFHYGKEGQRARAFVHSEDYGPTMRWILERYGHMGGCCGEPVRPGKASNDPIEGDVLAACLWRGNRHVLGVVSQRLYPRVSFPMRLWVHPGDVAAMPNMFREIRPEPPQENTALQRFDESEQLSVVQVEGFAQIRKALFGGEPPPPPTLEDLQDVEPAAVAPNIDRISALARQAYE